MTATALTRGARVGAAELARPAAILCGLAAVVAVRWGILADGRLDGIATGLLFGIGLVAVGVGGGWRLGGAVDRRFGTAVDRPNRAAARRQAIDVGLGVAGGLLLVGLALVARAGLPEALARPLPGPGLAAPFGPWLGVTLLVAFAEELVLRGVLFTQLERLGGPAAAVVVTSLAFAGMHVPVYGWHVVPLDFGVGIFLGGLRLATGRWLAPGIAHAVADVATWWL